MRLLYVPNEYGDFRQVGFRRPLQNLKSAGLLDDVSVFSLLLRVRKGGDPRDHIDALIQRIQQFKPDVILMQHLGGTHLRARDFAKMRRAAEFKLIYHEADPYSRYLHPLPPEARNAGKAADVVFTVGSGIFAENFRRAGASDVRFESHCFESERYDRMPVSAGLERPYDVVVVANRNRPRLRGHPDWRARIRFTELLERRFASRVAIFGKNWTGPSSQGPVQFDQQQSAIRAGWISANWDHYAKEASYFSNRLPISLAAGSIHATTDHPGYSNIFDGEAKRFLIRGRSPEHLVDSIDAFLQSTPPSELAQLQAAAQDYAYKNFRQDDQLVRMLNFDRPVIDTLAAREAWNEKTILGDET